MSTLAQTLAQLRDIHAGPPPVEPGVSAIWWLLPPVLIVLGLGVFLWRCAPLCLAGWQLYRLHRFRPHEDAPSPHPLAEYTGIAGLSAWLKTSTLLAYPRQEVAALHGERWLQWLDQHSPATWLSLSEHWSGWLYGGRSCNAQEYHQVWQLCRRWWLHLLWRRLCWH